MDEQKQICSKCNVEKPSGEYYFRKDYNKYRRQCKICYTAQSAAYRRNRYKNDENFRLLQKTRSRIYEALNGRGKSFRTRYILGISLDLYKKWIEFQMSPEMNWLNIHVDHVKPTSLFNLSNEDELLECFNWINTQPLLKKDNFKKK